MTDLVCGIDGGKTNLALSFLNRHTLVVEEAYNIDLTIRNGCKLDLQGYEWMGEAIDKWIQKLSPLFRRCSKVGIERAYRGLAREFLHVVNAHLESNIRAAFPHLEEIRIVDPKKVRAALNTSGGEYAVRKRKSVESECISDVDRKRFYAHFKKEVYSKKNKTWSLKTKADDVIESCLIALYLATHYEMPPPIVVKAFKTEAAAAISIRNVQMHLPDPSRKPTKKRKAPKSPSTPKPTKKRKAPDASPKRKRVRAS